MVRVRILMTAPQVRVVMVVVVSCPVIVMAIATVVDLGPPPNV